MLERVVSVELLLAACDHFRCVRVDTFKSKNNRQNLLLYLRVPGFCIGEGKTCVPYGLAVLKYCCAKALACITLYGEVL